MVVSGWKQVLSVTIDPKRLSLWNQIKIGPVTIDPKQIVSLESDYLTSFLKVVLRCWVRWMLLITAYDQ